MVGDVFSSVGKPGGSGGRIAGGSEGRIVADVFSFVGKSEGSEGSEGRMVGDVFSFVGISGGKTVAEGSGERMVVGSGGKAFLVLRFNAQLGDCYNRLINSYGFQLDRKERLLPRRACRFSCRSFS